MKDVLESTPLTYNEDVFFAISKLLTLLVRGIVHLSTQLENKKKKKKDSFSMKLSKWQAHPTHC